MAIDLYYMVESPPSRTVLMVAKLLDLNLNLISLDLSKEEHLKKEFIELNPCHCVPTLLDKENGLVLWESRVIITYLINRFRPSHRLYPSDPKLRATIDKFLHFDLGTIYNSISFYSRPVFFGGQIEETSEQKLKETLNLFDSMVEKNQFVCGQELTLADISIISGFTLLEALDYQINEWTHICRWIQTIKRELKEVYEEINSKAIENTRLYIKFLKKEKNI